MKQILSIFLCLMAAAAGVAQTIKASDIIKQINEGHTVVYSNVQIEGDLDLTNLENRRLVHSTSNRFNDDFAT